MIIILFWKILNIYFKYFTLKKQKNFSQNLIILLSK